MRALPLLLAVLLLAAPVGAVVGPASLADDPAASGGDAAAGGDTVAADATNHTDNRTRYGVLTVPDDDVRRAGLREQGADVGPTLGIAVDESSYAMETAAMRNHVEAAETNDERQRRIIAALSEVEQAEVTLNQRHTDAIAAHAAGDLTDRELLVELAAIAVTAEALRDRLAVLRALSEETADFSRESRINELDFRLQPYSGAVRTHAAAVAAGDADAERFYVESGESGVTLTAIVDGAYVRETFRGDRWVREGSSFENEADGENVTAREFPDAWAERARSSAISAGGIARVDVTYPQGELRTFNSADSDRVFKEDRVQPLDGYDHDLTATSTRDGLNVTVNYSYRGAPVEVVVRDEETGEPVEGATVTVGVGDESEPVGVTDAEGRVYTLAPSGTYDVTVIDGNDVVLIEGVEPTEPPAGGESAGNGTATADGG